MTERKLMEGVPPEGVAFYRGLYSPHFQRELRTWWSMKDWSLEDPRSDFIDQTGYCLDAIEPPAANGIF
jgi:hypothetical protein